MKGKLFGCCCKVDAGGKADARFENEAESRKVESPHYTRHLQTPLSPRGSQRQQGAGIGGLRLNDGRTGRKLAIHGWKEVIFGLR